MQARQTRSSALVYGAKIANTSPIYPATPDPPTPTPCLYPMQLAGFTDISALLANITFLAPNDDAFNVLMANPPPELAAAFANPSDSATQELLVEVSSPVSLSPTRTGPGLCDWQCNQPIRRTSGAVRRHLQLHL